MRYLIAFILAVTISACASSRKVMKNCEPIGQGFYG
jgi:hypothetical protein